MEISGAKKPDGKTLDGVSLVPLLTGGTTINRDAIFWHFPAYLEGGDSDLIQFFELAKSILMQI